MQQATWVQLVGWVSAVSDVDLLDYLFLGSFSHGFGPPVQKQLSVGGINDSLRTWKTGAE